jgi:hypothetical protein
MPVFATFDTSERGNQMADVFRLTAALTGITFTAEGQGSLLTLPVDARLNITGQSRLAGLIEVKYGTKLYSVFKIDLIERSVTMRALASAA